MKTIPDSKPLQMIDISNIVARIQTRLEAVTRRSMEETVIWQAQITQLEAQNKVLNQANGLAQ